MAESLRGGLSLALCGFGFWSHDIGGFEGQGPVAVYKRWVAFGLLSSHSRLHGSSSYRVPWNYDDQACDVLRFFTKLKCSLMPYLYGQAVVAHREGVPMMRAMLLEFPGDPASDTLDRQYMLGDALLVAPVFTEDGTVDYYLPEGRWTHLLTGEVQTGGRWRRARHDFLSLPLFVRPSTILPVGRSRRPSGLRLHSRDHVPGLQTGRRRRRLARRADRARRARGRAARQSRGAKEWWRSSKAARRSSPGSSSWSGSRR